MDKKYFTLEEVNRLIPRIDELIRQVQTVQQSIRSKHRQLREAKHAANETGQIMQGHSFFAEEAELDFLMIEGNQLLSAINQLGGQVKDVDHGLVDFYTIIQGQEAFLCWRQGEPRIQHWHGTDEGFAKRKPL